MSLNSLSYDTVTEKLGCSRCNGCSIGNHRLGWVDMSSGTIHWADRALRRSGLRTYLKLAAAIAKSHNQGQPEWQRIYEQSIWAQSTALALFGLRLPGKWSYIDRARVEYLSTRSAVPRNVISWAKSRG